MQILCLVVLSLVESLQIVSKLLRIVTMGLNVLQFNPNCSKSSWIRKYPKISLILPNTNCSHELDSNDLFLTICSSVHVFERVDRNSIWFVVLSPLCCEFAISGLPYHIILKWASPAWIPRGAWLCWWETHISFKE